jgi:L-methionine (R)-S-oxide reductase
VNDVNKDEAYRVVLSHCRGLLKDETDLIAAMATIACELHHGIFWFDWTGFYRVASPGLLKVGPYQGGHGCLSIPFERGVCGKCAREGLVQIVRDVRQLPYHIACSSHTLSEIVVPVFNSSGEVRAVLDVDSETLGAFDEVDSRFLEEICGWLAPLYDSR